MRRALALFFVVAGCGGAATSRPSSSPVRPAAAAPAPVAEEAARDQLVAAWSSVVADLGAWRVGTFRFGDGTRTYEGTAVHVQDRFLELRGATATCFADAITCRGASGAEPRWALQCRPDSERPHAFFAQRAGERGFPSGTFALAAATVPYTNEPPCGQPHAGEGRVDLRAATPTFDDTLAVFPAAVHRELELHRVGNAERLVDVELTAPGPAASLRMTFGSEAVHVVDGTSRDDRWLQTSTTYETTVRPGARPAELLVDAPRLVSARRYDCHQWSTRLGHARVLWPPTPYDAESGAGCREL